MKTKFKYIVLVALVVGLASCEGRRDFPALVETGVTFENSDILLISGQSDTIRARFEPNIEPQRNYSWSVADPSVADIEVNADKSATVTATGSGETTVRIVSQDADSLSAETRLKVISGAPVDITNEGSTLTVNRENSGGSEAGEGSPKVIDGDLSTKYLSDYMAPFYLTLQFDQQRVVSFYRLTSGNDAPDRDPLDWQIQGSNDGENWETLDERTGEKFDGRNLTREFYFENETAYSYYRFNVLKNNGGGLFQMSEWALLSIPN